MAPYPRRKNADEGRASLYRGRADGVDRKRNEREQNMTQRKQERLPGGKRRGVPPPVAFFRLSFRKSVVITDKICYTDLGFIYVSGITMISEHL